jgi:hypothetical protein
VAITGCLGPAKDISSGEFTESVKDEAVVDFQRFYIKVGGMRFDAKMKYVSARSKWSLSNQLTLIERYLKDFWRA